MGGGKAENDNLRSGQAHHATSTGTVSQTTVSTPPAGYSGTSLSAGRGGEGGGAATGSDGDDSTDGEETAKEDLDEVRYTCVLPQERVASCERTLTYVTFLFFL